MKMTQFTCALPGVVKARIVLLLAVLLLSNLSGCATQPYGSFIDDLSPAAGEIMAEDVVAQLLPLYLPATTQFRLRHRSHDPFGMALLDKLRSQGYAVQEMVKTSPLQTGDNGLSGNDPVSTNSLNGRALAYIIDRVGNWYHVSILVDEQQLSRAFVAQADGFVPAGVWLHRQ
jgi:hypothetical protein